MTQNSYPSFGSLVLTSGWPGLCRTLHAEVREPEPAHPAPGGEPPATPAAGGRAILDFVASDESLDRYGETILASGWQLEHYRRNPVFQNAHQYGDILFTLGRALVTEIRTGAGAGGGSSSYLFQRVEFAVDANPMARIAYDLYRGKFLNAVSVGFIPLRWQDADGTVHPARGRSARAEADVAARPFQRRYLEQELLEVSAVGIPANPNALAQACQAGVVQRSDLRELAHFLRCPPQESPPAGATARPSLMALARQLQRLLRHRST